MSCDNCDCAKCKASRVVPKQKITKASLGPQERALYADPKYWCQCGAWKYTDALACEECWNAGATY